MVLDRGPSQNCPANSGIMVIGACRSLPFSSARKQKNLGCGLQRSLKFYDFAILVGQVFLCTEKSVLTSNQDVIELVFLLLGFPQPHCRLARTHRCMPNAEKGRSPIDMTSDLKDGPCVWSWRNVCNYNIVQYEYIINLHIRAIHVNGRIWYVLCIMQ